MKDKKKIKDDEEIGKVLSNASHVDLESIAALLQTDALKAEIERFNEIEAIDMMNKQLGNMLPMTSTAEMQLHMIYTKTCKLRSALDKLRQMTRERTHRLSELVMSSEGSSQAADMQSALNEHADLTLRTIEHRYLMMTDAFEDAKGFHDHLNRLIVFCSVKPPYSDRHVAALEQQLLLAKQQIKDVMRFRASLYLETERLESTTIRKVKLRIKAIQHQRASISSKIEKRRLAIDRSKKELALLGETLAELREMSASTEGGMVLLSSSFMSAASQETKPTRNSAHTSITAHPTANASANVTGFHPNSDGGDHFILSQDSGEANATSGNHKIRFGELNACIQTHRYTYICVFSFPMLDKSYLTVIAITPLY
jgi:hypothetical protein